jgi:cysteine desulfurase/selenocysteine lyase
VGFLYSTAERLEAAPAVDRGSTMAQCVNLGDFTPKPPPHRFAAGEPAFGEVAGWGAAISYWTRLGLQRIEAYEKNLTGYAVERLQAIKGVRIFRQPKGRIAVISFVVKGQDPKETETLLDERGIAVRAGKLSAEPLLKIVGVEKAGRASLMSYNTREEVDVLAEALKETRPARQGS